MFVCTNFLQLNAFILRQICRREISNRSGLPGIIVSIASLFHESFLRLWHHLHQYFEKAVLIALFIVRWRPRTDLTHSLQSHNGLQMQNCHPEKGLNEPLCCHPFCMMCICLPVFLIWPERSPDIRFSQKIFMNGTRVTLIKHCYPAASVLPTYSLATKNAGI